MREKYPSPIAGMKDLFKNKFPLDRKKPFSSRSLWQNIQKWFVLTRKSVSTTRNEAFIEKYVSWTRKNFLSDKKIKENGFHLHKNVFLLKLVPKNFGNGFQHQKKSSEQKHTVSTRQKMFSLFGIWKNRRECFSLARNLIYISWNKVLF